MHNKALHEVNGTYLVERPASSKLLDAVTSLAALCCPKREGFYPAAGTTHIARFLVDRESPLHPITYGTGVNVLACYTARFSDGKLGVLIISGESLSDTCKSGVLRDEMIRLHSHSANGHRVLQHNLTTVKTPTPSDATVSCMRFHEYSVLMPTIFKYPFRRGDELMPHLTLRPVALHGWKESSLRLPKCSFSSICNGEHIQLEVSWGGRSEDQVSINLTEPLATFIPLRR